MANPRPNQNPTDSLFPADFDDDHDVLEEDAVLEGDEDEEIVENSDESEDEAPGSVRVQEPNGKDAPQPAAPAQPNDAYRLQQYERTLIPALKREAEQYKVEAERLKSETATLNQYRSQLQSFGLAAEDATAGLQMVAALKANPVKFINDLATRLRVAGHNIDTAAGGDPHAATIAEAVYSKLAAELAPLREARERQQQEQQMQRQVEEQMTNLFYNIPEAQLHQGEMAAIMQDHLQKTGRPMAAEMAFAQLARYAAMNGLDISKPLRPQWEAKQNPATPNNPTGTTTRAPVSNRRAGAPPVNQRQMEDQFEPELDYRTAIRDVFRDMQLPST